MSVYGGWYLANLLNRPDDIERYSGELRRRARETDLEQADIPQQVFQLLVNKHFSPHWDVREIANEVDTFLSRLSDARRIDRMGAEALIRDALGEDVILDGLSFADRLNVYIAFSIAMIYAEGISETEVLGLVLRAEEVLKRRGVELEL
jgi:hypothetical protein